MARFSVAEVAPIRSMYMATESSMDGVAIPIWFKRPIMILILS
jgi:hypothetical protein